MLTSHSDAVPKECILLHKLHKLTITKLYVTIVDLCHVQLFCCQMVDNEPRSLGVIINVDYLVNGEKLHTLWKHKVSSQDALTEKRPLRYSEIKVLDEEEEKEIGKKEPLPIMDHKANLKVCSSTACRVRCLVI